MAFKQLDLSRDNLSNLDLMTLLNIRDCEVQNEEITNNLKIQVEFNKRKREIMSYCQLPEIIFDEEELDIFHINSSIPNYIGSEKVTSEFVEINERLKVKDLNLKGKIALIKRADPGYDWLFAQDIIGLITLYGGANSHMAIRSAEFNITASIGVGEKLYSKLLQNKIIEIDPVNKTIQGL